MPILMSEDSTLSQVEIDSQNYTTLQVEFY